MACCGSIPLRSPSADCSESRHLAFLPFPFQEWNARFHQIRPMSNPRNWESCFYFFGWRSRLGVRVTLPIVNGGDWLWSPANIKGANKDAKIYVRRSTTLHNLLFCVHTLCMNYVTSTFLLVSSSVRSKQLLCFVQGQGQKREQKHTTKNFVGFHNHSLY